MKITKGDYKVFQFVRKDSKGNVIQTIPEKIYFTVKSDANSSKVLIQKTLEQGISVSDDYVYSIMLEANDTDNLWVGNYVYDIEIKNSNRPKTITKGIFEITYEVTTAKDEA